MTIIETEDGRHIGRTAASIARRLYGRDVQIDWHTLRGATGTLVISGTGGRIGPVALLEGTRGR